MKKSISIIGGDLRIWILAHLLKKDGIDVFTYGFENAKSLDEIYNSDLKNSENNIIKCENLKQCIFASDVIVSSIPFTKDEIFVNEEFAKSKIKLEEVLNLLENKTFVAGKIPNSFYEKSKIKNIKIIDILKNEEFTILNCISTSEGAIKIAIEETKITLNGSNILILGFGRIGKILSKMLEGFGANVYCEARKKEDLAWITAFGYKKIDLQNLEENLNKFDLIFNTIPYIILDEPRLNLIKKDACIIDLASKPYGVDKDAIEKFKIDYILAKALPRKSCTRKCSKNNKTSFRKRKINIKKQISKI